ncbi:hypothetical protein Lqui_2503 [Legionella quinlivanii]|uniref:Uncharacterized protein n=1 Tax=Legionella quinlivanii TaxID=45073 RepID=A0A0W0XQF9_9GAMM|nr:hypothetical protein [Legionella quinlivanii]KTD46578.1 hypothetical protein Lqui_2503 [Legionella quinlivanii]SEG08855.1 hypothetical protein SAMN02746093_01825 [Legionella quinlivanii DSM 21216]STY10267.1 Uncharacterised protein [Legionella quinlivanii]
MELHQKARALFNKDKSIAPKTIEEIAKGELSTSKWLVACAIEILLEEKPNVVQKILSDSDILFLWATPLLKNHRPLNELRAYLASLNNAETLSKKLNTMTDFS